MTTKENAFSSLFKKKAPVEKRNWREVGGPNEKWIEATARRAPNKEAYINFVRGFGTGRELMDFINSMIPLLRPEMQLKKADLSIIKELEKAGEQELFALVTENKVVTRVVTPWNAGRVMAAHAGFKLERYEHPNLVYKLGDREFKIPCSGGEPAYKEVSKILKIASHVEAINYEVLPYHYGVKRVALQLGQLFELKNVNQQITMISRQRLTMPPGLDSEFADGYEMLVGYARGVATYLSGKFLNHDYVDANQLDLIYAAVIENFEPGGMDWVKFIEPMLGVSDGLLSVYPEWGEILVKPEPEWIEKEIERLKEDYTDQPVTQMIDLNTENTNFETAIGDVRNEQFDACAQYEQLHLTGDKWGDAHRLLVMSHLWDIVGEAEKGKLGPTMDKNLILIGPAADELGVMMNDDAYRGFRKKEVGGKEEPYFKKIVVPGDAYAVEGARVVSSKTVVYKEYLEEGKYNVLFMTQFPERRDVDQIEPFIKELKGYLGVICFPLTLGGYDQAINVNRWAKESGFGMRQYRHPRLDSATWYVVLESGTESLDDMTVVKNHAGFCHQAIENTRRRNASIAFGYFLKREEIVPIMSLALYEALRLTDKKKSTPKRLEKLVVQNISGILKAAEEQKANGGKGGIPPDNNNPPPPGQPGGQGGVPTTPANNNPPPFSAPTQGGGDTPMVGMLDDDVEMRDEDPNKRMPADSVAEGIGKMGVSPGSAPKGKRPKGGGKT